MNDYLHYEFDTDMDDVVEVTLGRVTPTANVQILDSINFAHYRNGESFNYHGGYVTNKVPLRLRLPQPGHWHLVIDLGGNPGILRAEVKVAAVPRSEGRLQQVA